MNRLKQFFYQSATNARLRRYIVAFVMLAGLIWFIPPVWRLKNDSIEVTRWIKSKGKVTAKVGPKEKGWTKYNRMSRHTINAVLAAEDGKFYQHHGLDLASILDSMQYNWKKGGYARGGSTITQQLVKMAFLSRDKTIVRKAREAVGALLLESVLEKKQILEWYLNMVEFGDGIYGLDAAARNYFGSKPELLTTAQSIHLALVLPSPNRWSVGLRKRNLTPFGHRRFAAIVSNMYRGGYITKDQWINALAAGNFGAPIMGYQAVVAQYDLESQLSASDPRFVAPQTGELEDAPDAEVGDNPTAESPVPPASASVLPTTEPSQPAEPSVELIPPAETSPDPRSSVETEVDSPSTAPLAVPPTEDEAGTTP